MATHTYNCKGCGSRIETTWLHAQRLTAQDRKEIEATLCTGCERAAKTKEAK